MTGAQEAVDRILDRGGSNAEVLQGVVDVLHDRVDHYSWIGIYLVDGDDLALGPWKGPQATEHVRIPSAKASAVQPPRAGRPRSWTT